MGGNWKMNKTAREAVQTLEDLRESVEGVEGIEMVVFPPFTVLGLAEKVLRGSSIGLGAQNMHWEAGGSYTGEISAPMLVDLGCRYVILGHSERRQYFGESNEGINKKIRSALSFELIPVVCVGETLKERKEGSFKRVVETQLELCLKGIDSEEAHRLVIAYEPVWAIGTGVTATPEQAEEMHSFVRKLLAKLFGENLADSMRIQYGGSVRPENIKELMREPDIDGALIGGASLDASSFAKIVKYGE
jgi:triosephosphate isomerase